MKVFNGEEVAITVVTNGCKDTVIQPKSSATIETSARFNSDDFYVEGDGDWQCKYNGADLEIYGKQFYGWSSKKSECGAFETTV